MYRHSLTYVYFLMPATHAQETGSSRNLCKSSCTRNLHVCRSILYKFFLVHVSCRQLSTALSIPGQKLSDTWHESCNVIGRRVYCARNCDKFASNSSYKCLVPISCTSVCRRYYLHNHLPRGGAAGADGQLMCGQWDTRSWSCCHGMMCWQRSKTTLTPRWGLYHKMAPLTLVGWLSIAIIT